MLPSYFIKIFHHLWLCLATAIHNLKWLKISRICLIWAQLCANIDVKTYISFPITVIWSINTTV